MVSGSVNLDIFATAPAGEKPHGGCGSCGNGAGAARCGNGLEKIYPTTAIRFGYMRFIGEFSHAPDMRFTCGAKVVMQTRRGIEMGEQVSLTCNGCDKSVTRDQMKEWVQRCGSESFLFDAGRILREATAADLGEYARIQQGCREKRDFAQQAADRQKLPIRVVECESLFGGERIIYFFTATERVDFRAMVRDLATEYRTRIEMRQVGARDEARLLADYETCGREVCCKVFLKTLRPISMRMAKMQKATLDPTQVSGRCGRLKCCLRYEHIGYEELDKKLPRVGVRIRTHHGEGVIVNRQILTQLVQIRTDQNKFVTVVAEDITEVNVRPSAPPAAAPTRERARRAEPPKPRVPLRDDGKPPSESRPLPSVRDRGDGDAPGKDDVAERDAGVSDTDKPRAGTEEAASRPRRRGRRRRRRRRGNGEGKPGGEQSPPSSDS